MPETEETPPVFNLDRLHEILTVYKLPLVFLFLSLMLFGGGILAWQSVNKSANVVFEDNGITAESSKSATIQADLEGAVIKPGVYELSFGSRISDLLILAGGLAEEADREWVEKNLNLAAKVTDGGKIYIPSISNVGAQNFAPPTEGNLNKLININSASLSELDNLSGIGAVTAQKIIEGRPYQNLEELVSRKVISKSVFEKIKEKIGL